MSAPLDDPELRALFRDEMGRYVDLLARGAWGDWARVTHQVKGAARMLGLDALSDAAASLELALRDDDAPGAVEALAALRASAAALGVDVTALEGALPPPRAEARGSRARRARRPWSPWTRSCRRGSPRRPARGWSAWARRCRARPTRGPRRGSGASIRPCATCTR
ncbi:MAG: Hpt domain-containing protein [Polyangiales bacterium]